MTCGGRFRTLRAASGQKGDPGASMLSCSCAPSLRPPGPRSSPWGWEPDGLYPDDYVASTSLPVVLARLSFLNSPYIPVRREPEIDE